MSLYAEITNENIRKYLADEDKISRYFFSYFNDSREGWVSAFGSGTRTYFEQIILDKDTRLVYIELAIDVSCPKQNRAAVSDYLTRINSVMKTGNFRMLDNGHIYAHVSQYFIDGPVSVDTIEELEHDLIAMAERNSEKIMNVAVTGVVPDPKEEIIKEIDRRIEELRKQLESSSEDDGEDGELTGSWDDDWIDDHQDISDGEKASEEKPEKKDGSEETDELDGVTIDKLRADFIKQIVKLRDQKKMMEKQSSEEKEEKEKETSDTNDVISMDDFLKLIAKKNSENKENNSDDSASEDD